MKSDASGTSFGSDPLVSIDVTETDHGLIRFLDIFGNSPGQLPIGSMIVNATLTVTIPNQGAISTTLHRMRVNWNEGYTWDSLVNGIQPPQEAEPNPDATIPSTLFPSLTIDISTGVQAWSNGVENFGWALLPPASGSADGWAFASANNPSESDRPLLSITFLFNDCDANGIDDALDIANCPPNDPSCADCQPNMVPDDCDITNMTSQDANGNGIPDECEAIPTVSQWGAMAMALLLGAGGTIVYRRRGGEANAPRRGAGL